MATHQPYPRGNDEGLTFGSLRTFFLAAFGLSWGMGMLYVAFSAQVESGFGPMGYINPVFILMVYAPGLVGLSMVWHHHGRAGLKSFFRRFTLWRMSLLHPADATTDVLLPRNRTGEAATEQPELLHR